MYLFKIKMMHPTPIIVHRASLKGLRPTNEDVEISFLNLCDDGTPTNPNYPPIDFFLICDGHGGKEIAEFVGHRLQHHLVNNKRTYPIDKKNVNKIFDYIQNEIATTMLNIGINCGCTALIVIRYMDEKFGESIQTINLGDCRAVISSSGRAIPLTIDHKPIWPNELERIRAVNIKNHTNNKVRFFDGDWRIHDLSVSRAFGDISAKPEVSHIPESFEYRISPYDKFIIMACDGLWDVYQNHDAVNYVQKQILYDKNTNVNIAKKIADHAISKLGSTDNVSVFIIEFNRHN